MASRIAQMATSPLLSQFAISASQKAIRKVGNFLCPLCEVPDLTFRYKVYDSQNRYRIPSTKRDPGGKVTRLGFSSTDAAGILEPNALDFPIPNVAGLSDEALSYSIMEGQSLLADASALSLENEQIQLAIAALTGSKGTSDFSSDSIDPIAVLDDTILSVIKAAKNGAPVKVLFGATMFKHFRNNAKVRGRFVVGKADGKSVGSISPAIGDVGNLLMTNPEIELSMMVLDTSAPGTTEDISFLLDESVIVFASNSTPNRMDPSFAKTFAPMGAFFKPGTYVTEDQRDEVLKMDWTTKPTITNSAAAKLITKS